MTQMYFCIGNVMMSVVRGANGFMTADVLKAYPSGLMGLIVGLALGSLVFKHIPGKVFPYIVYSYIVISGIVIFFTAL